MQRRQDGRLVVDPGQVADADALPGDELEVDEVLKRSGDPLAPLRQRQEREVGAVDLDDSPRRFVEAAQQFDDRRLAGAVLADDGDRRAGRQGDVDVLQDGLAGLG